VVLMPWFQIKDYDEHCPPQVMAEFKLGEEAIEQEWLEWLDLHGLEHQGVWRETDGNRSYFCWILDLNVLLAYKLKFG
jgi:hypothetical protein